MGAGRRRRRDEKGMGGKRKESSEGRQVWRRAKDKKERRCDKSQGRGEERRFLFSAPLLCVLPAPQVNG